MQQETPNTPTEARVKNKRRISPFWLLPFIALLIAGWLVYNNFQERGTTVTIDFQSAAGIVAGRTPVRYQGVEVGTVQSISLSKDLRSIVVHPGYANTNLQAVGPQMSGSRVGVALMGLVNKVIAGANKLGAGMESMATVSMARIGAPDAKADTSAWDKLGADMGKASANASA